MSAEPVARRAPSTWTAVAWAESFTVLGLGLIAFGFVRAVLTCLDASGRCTADDPTGGLGPLLIVAGIAAVCGAAFAAAYLSGQKPVFVRSLLALLGLAGALALGALVLSVVLGDVAPALVLGLVVEGLAAIRPPSARALRLRLVAAVVLFLAACLLSRVGTDGTAFVLALLVFPAFGLADSIAANEQVAANQQS